jgi:Ser-tRNA(Ala) deacylase AlaX
MSHYTVQATREGKWWSLQCIEVPGAISQVSRLDQAADTIREAIAWVADVPEESIEITVTPILPESVLEHLAAAARLRAESARLNTQAAEQTRAAVGELHTSQHLTYREIGAALGISHQRASQLAAESKQLQDA